MDRIAVACSSCSSSSRQDPSGFGFGVSSSGKTIGENLYRRNLETGLSPFESLSLRYDSKGMEGAVARVAAECALSATIRVGQPACRGRMTAVLKRQGGRWLLAQIHFLFPHTGRADIAQEEGR